MILKTGAISTAVKSPRPDMAPGLVPCGSERREPRLASAGSVRRDHAGRRAPVTDQGLRGAAR